VARRRREQSPISTAKLRPRHLATQHRDLVAQDQQLEVLGVQATATPNERSKQGSEREVEEREGHTGDPSSRRPDEARHDYWRPSGLLRRSPPERNAGLVRVPAVERSAAGSRSIETTSTSSSTRSTPRARTTHRSHFVREPDAVLLEEPQSPC
jgi:hypothetical protein